jgi:hypothetical protein
LTRAIFTLGATQGVLTDLRPINDQNRVFFAVATAAAARSAAAVGYATADWGGAPCAAGRTSGILAINALAEGLTGPSLSKRATRIITGHATSRRSELINAICLTIRHVGKASDCVRRTRANYRETIKLLILNPQIRHERRQRRHSKSIAKAICWIWLQSTCTQKEGRTNTLAIKSIPN